MAQIDVNLAQWALDKARGYGATAAEVLGVTSESLAAGVRKGEVEKLKSSRERRLGLRVFAGQSSATSSTADLERAALDDFISHAVKLARLTAPDPWSGLPDPKLHSRELAELGLADSEHGIIGVEQALALARRAEGAALKFDPQIKNSEGAEFDSESHRVLFANSQGFCAEYNGTSYSLGVAPIAQSAEEMQQGYWYSVNRFFNRLEEPESIGTTAARRALRRLGARKIKTVRAPVVFDPDMAASLVRSVAGACSGSALYRSASFLLNRLGERVAAPQVTIIDDGTIPGGLGSKPCDGEGLPTSRKAVIEAGTLKSYLLDSYSARRLGLSPTGNAARSVGDNPSAAPTNLYLSPGHYSPEEIIRSVPQGLYLTELIGFGVNIVTGDYSRGASGLWIERGELVYPVQEITIAGNLREMLLAIEMIGNDLQWRGSVASPTLKMAEMIIAGA
jgi:PmbA protein